MNNNMATNTYLSIIESIKQTKQTERTEKYSDTENFDGGQVGGDLKGLVKKRKGLRSTNWLLQNSRGDAKHRIGNRVNNVLTTMHLITGV